MDRKRSKRGDGPSAAKISDARFSSFETDPRFRNPSKRKHKTPIDKRFSRVLKGKSFAETPKVDKYGRKLKPDNKKKVLEKLYRLEDEDEDEDAEEDNDDDEIDDDDEVQRELRRADEKYDPARGGGFSSSDSEDESEGTAR